MKILKLDRTEDLASFRQDWQKRSVIPLEVLSKVLTIIEAVRKKGDEALIEYTKQFDGLDLKKTGMEIDPAEIEKAYNEHKDLRQMLEIAAKRIEKYHQEALPKHWFYTDEYGNLLGQRLTPVDRVGVYCPGGKAAYPSSVLMNVIPAQVAGVREIIMCVPTPRGEISPAVLVAAKIAGVKRLFRLGGAQAIAAMAYGTESVPKVDFICGPGNIYVAAAKKLVFGEVGIDMVAGPSEIAVVADGSVPAKWCAADLLSQAEHDEMASPILITTAKTYAQEVERELEKQLSELSRQKIAATSLEKQGHIFIVPDLKMAAAVVNIIAPEHLELLVEDPFALLTEIRHAGAIFLGKYAAEPIGDYIAGPNHTLPTSGTARFSSVLSTETFLKRTSILFITQNGLKTLGPKAIQLAQIEGLTAHAASIEKRLETLKNKEGSEDEED